MSTTPDRSIRPREAVRGRDDTTIASIILYNTSTPAETTATTKFLDDLSQFVASPIASGRGTSSGGDIAMLDLDENENNKYYGIFNNFVLSGVSESDRTISKLSMNFSGSWNIFFFNENPTMLTFSGGFFDTAAYPYYQEFMVAYEKYMAGSKLLENKLNMIISYDGKIIDGYITDINVSSSAVTEGFKSFTFSVIAKKITWDRENDVKSFSDGTTTKMYNAMTNATRLRDYGIDTGFDLAIYEQREATSALNTNGANSSNDIG